MSLILSYLTDFSSSSTQESVFDLSSFHLFSLTPSDYSLLHQFFRNGGTLLSTPSSPPLSNNSGGSGGGIGGGSGGGDNLSSSSVSPFSIHVSAIERILLPSFDSHLINNYSDSDEIGRAVYSVVELLNVLDCASKSEALVYLSSIENFHSFTSLFLSEKWMTASLLESMIEICSKIIKRIHRRQSAYRTFGIHGGGNIGLGLVADLITKPHRNINIFNNHRPQSLSSASDHSHLYDSPNLSIRHSSSSSILNSFGSISSKGDNNNIINNNNISITASPRSSFSGSLPSFPSSIASLLSSNINITNKSLFGGDNNNKTISAPSSVSSSEGGPHNKMNDWRYRIVATTNRAFLRELINTGHNVRIRHRVVRNNSSKNLQAMDNNNNNNNPSYTYTEVPQVHLIDRSSQSIRDLYTKSSFVALCLTLNAFQESKKDIALGLISRYLYDEMPLTIFLCMNGTGNEQAVRDGVFNELIALTNEQFARKIFQNIRIHECVVDRIVRHLDDNEIAEQIIQQVTALQNNSNALLLEPSASNLSTVEFDMNMKSLTDNNNYNDNNGGNGSMVSSNTADALFELCAVTINKEKILSMINNPLEARRLAQLLFLFKIRIALFDAERLCSLHTTPFIGSASLPHFSLTHDIKIYEQIKNRYINGPHSSIAWLGGLCGYHKIKDAILQSSFIRSFINELMDYEIAPVIQRSHHQFAPPSRLLLSMKENFFIRCAENEDDTVYRVGRDPMRKLNRGRRIRGTLELYDKYKLNSSTHRLEMCYIAGLLYSIQSIDPNDQSSAKLKEIYYQNNKSYHALLTYQGPSASGTFFGFHPQRDQERIKRMIAMIPIVEQLIIAEKIKHLGLLIDFSTGHLSYNYDNNNNNSTSNNNSTHSTNTTNSPLSSSLPSTPYSNELKTDIQFINDNSLTTDDSIRLLIEENIINSNNNGINTTTTNNNHNRTPSNQSLSPSLTPPPSISLSWIPCYRYSFELIYIRHGETYGNCGQSNSDGSINKDAVEKNIKNKEYRIFQGDVDTEINQLTDDGKKQAEIAVDLLEKNYFQEGWYPDIIISSPLKRAVDTAAPLLSRYSNYQSIFLIEELCREMRFGLADNKRINDLLLGAGAGDNNNNNNNYSNNTNNNNTDWRLLCHSFYRNQNASYKFPGDNGESFCNLLWRVHNALQLFEQRYKGKKILLYGHSMWGAASAILLGKGTIITPDNNNNNNNNNTPNNNNTKSYIAFDGVHCIPHAQPFKLN